MAFPFLPLGIAAGSVGFNALMRALNRPRESDYDLDTDEIERLLAQSINRSAEGTASLAGQAAAQRAGAQGLSGGSFVSAVNQAEAPVYAGAANEISSRNAELALMKALRKGDYRRDRGRYRSDFLTGLGSDVMGAGMGIAGGLMQQSSLDKLIGAYGGGATAAPSTPYTGQVNVGASSPVPSWRPQSTENFVSRRMLRDTYNPWRLR